MDTNTTLWLVLGVIALIVIGAIVMAWRRVQRSNQLQERFGPEYDRALDELGDRRQAEKELESRLRKPIPCRRAGGDSRSAGPRTSTDRHCPP